MFEQKPRVQFMTLRQRESKAGRTYYVGYQGDLVFVGFEDRKEINGKTEKVIEVFVECSPREQRSSGRAATERGAERTDARSDARPESSQGETGVTGARSRSQTSKSSRGSAAAREVLDRHGGSDVALDDDIPF